MSVKQKFDISKKIYDILVILVDVCGQFFLYWLIFCYPDPFHETDQDPAGRNKMDPNGFEKLLYLSLKLIKK